MKFSYHIFLAELFLKLWFYAEKLSIYMSRLSVYFKKCHSRQFDKAVACSDLDVDRKMRYFSSNHPNKHVVLYEDGVVVGDNSNK